MAKVFIVVSECGYYSEAQSIIEGVFSSYERASNYIKSQRINLYHIVGNLVDSDGQTKPYDEWSTSNNINNLDIDQFYYKPDVNIVESVEIIPSKDNGTTYIYRGINDKSFAYAGVDGKRIYDEWVKTYFIKEFEIDK